MTPDQRLLLIGGYISSGLYLSGCFVAGLALHVGPAWKIALMAEGTSCVAYVAQLLSWHREGVLLVTLLSWTFGVIAGVCLLLGA